MELNNLRWRWVGKWVEAFSIANPDISATGIILQVEYDQRNDRFQYLLSDQLGFFHNPTLVA